MRKARFSEVDGAKNLRPRNLYNLMCVQFKGREGREGRGTTNTCCKIFRKLGIMQVKWLFLQLLFYFGDPWLSIILDNGSQSTISRLKCQKQMTVLQILGLELGDSRCLLPHSLPASSCTLTLTHSCVTTQQQPPHHLSPPKLPLIS